MSPYAGDSTPRFQTSSLLVFSEETVSLKAGAAVVSAGCSIPFLNHSDLYVTVSPSASPARA